jgi:hypothetical protein
LREAILAGAKASATRRNPWTRTLPWLAMAAGIMMVAAVGIAMWPTKASAERAQFTAFAVNDTLHAKHGGHGPGSGQLAAILSEPATRLSAGLPIDFSALQANGCRTVQFAGRDVLEVCFKRDGVWFHCYIGNRADFPGMPASEPPQFMEETKVAAASWADASHYFVLVGEGGLQAVKRLL